MVEERRRKYHAGETSGSTWDEVRQKLRNKYGFPKLIIELEAQIEIDKAIEWYESKQIGLGADFFNYLDGYFQTLKNGEALFEIKEKACLSRTSVKKISLHNYLRRISKSGDCIFCI